MVIQIGSGLLLRQWAPILLAATLLLAGCRAAETESNKTGSDSSPLSTWPIVGKVDDKAGFFVQVMSERDVRSKLNLHKGPTTFDEPCKGELGKVVDCYMDAEELTLSTVGFSFHYHVPKSMCSFVVFEPFYFVNRLSKRTNSLTRFIDKTGAVGIDNNTDGTVDSTDFGCYSPGGTPECCVGEYPQTTFIWDPETNKYGAPITEHVSRTLEKCLGGPASKTQSKDAFGVPLATTSFVKNKGISAEYSFEPLGTHGVGTGWVANFFDPKQHGDKAPKAFNDDIDSSDKIETYGNPYYKVACLDSAGETLAEIRVQIREWNTAVKYEARGSDPGGYDDTGDESDPWTSDGKNDFMDWLDFEKAGIIYPGFDFK
jgi:hypothetical protein